MVIGCGLLFFQAFTGINTVVFYSTTIFGLAGFKDSIIGSACWSFVNFLMTGVAARLIDSAGRRILLLRGTYVMLGALVLLAAILLADVQAKTQGDIAVLAVLIYVCGYAVSLGTCILFVTLFVCCAFVQWYCWPNRRNTESFYDKCVQLF